MSAANNSMRTYCQRFGKKGYITQMNLYPQRGGTMIFECHQAGVQSMPNRNTIGLAFCLCFALSSPVVALPCSLTEPDYQALQNTTEKSYAKSDIEALDPKDQEALCKARKFYREARGKDPRAFARTHTLNDIPARMSRFLTPEEYGQVRSAMNEVIVEDSIRKRSPSRDRK